MASKTESINLDDMLKIFTDPNFPTEQPEGDYTDIDEIYKLYQDTIYLIQACSKLKSSNNRISKEAAQTIIEEHLNDPNF